MMTPEEWAALLEDIDQAIAANIRETETYLNQQSHTRG